MRSVSDAFLDFQLTALFDKIMPGSRQINGYSRPGLVETAFHSCRCYLTAARYIYLRKPRRSISAR
jgi:hypothetical protein